MSGVPPPPAPSAPPQPRFKKRRRNGAVYGTVIASGIGLLALLVSAYTANLQRQQVRAQIWPHLQLWWSTGEKIFGTNEGVGPARVSRLRVSLDGRVMYKWADVVRALGQEGRVGFTMSSMRVRVFSPGAAADLFLINRQDEVARNMFAELTDNPKRKFNIVLCYCSVLDECWMTGLGQVEAPYGPLDAHRPVDRCPIPEEEAFRD